MDIQAIFLLQFFFSLTVYALISKWFVSPWLAGKALDTALILLILPHVFRHVGMAFLVPNLNPGPLAEPFASTAAYGDLAAAVLAIVAIISLRRSWKFKYGVVWIFNIVGTVDFANALSRGEALPYFGATWFIPAIFVPLLLVSHFLVFIRLFKRKSHTSISTLPVAE